MAGRNYPVFFPRGKVRLSAVGRDKPEEFTPTSKVAVVWYSQSVEIAKSFFEGESLCLRSCSQLERVGFSKNRSIKGIINEYKN